MGLYLHAFSFYPLHGLLDRGWFSVAHDVLYDESMFVSEFPAQLGGAPINSLDFDSLAPVRIEKTSVWPYIKKIGLGRFDLGNLSSTLKAM